MDKKEIKCPRCKSENINQRININDQVKFIPNLYTSYICSHCGHKWTIYKSSHYQEAT